MDRLDPGGQTAVNHMVLAAQAYFANGGHHLHVARVPGGNADGSGLPTLASFQAALDSLLAIDDISIVAAPGSAAYPPADAAAIARMLVCHAETPHAYRFAVLETPPGLDQSGAKRFRAGLASSHARSIIPGLAWPNRLRQARP